VCSSDLETVGRGRHAPYPDGDQILDSALVGGLD